MKDIIKHLTRSLRAILGMLKTDVLETAAVEEKENEDRRKEAEILAKELEDRRRIQIMLDNSRGQMRRGEIGWDNYNEEQERKRYAKMTPKERTAVDKEDYKRMGF